MRQIAVLVWLKIKRLTLRSCWSKAFGRFSVLCLAAITTTTFLVHGRDANKDEIYSALQDLRYGLVVTDLEGNVLIAHRADERFMPASNVKLFVTAVALALEDEGVAVLGDVLTRHRPLQFVDEPKSTDPDDQASPLQCVRTQKNASKKPSLHRLNQRRSRKSSQRLTAIARISTLKCYCANWDKPKETGPPFVAVCRSKIL